MGYKGTKSCVNEGSRFDCPFFRFANPNSRWDICLSRKDKCPMTKKIITRKKAVKSPHATKGGWDVKPASRSSLSAREKSPAPETHYPEPKQSGGLRVAEPLPGYLVAPLLGSLAATVSMLPVVDMAEILDVSPKTLTRWIKNGEQLSPQQTDRLSRLEAIFKHGEHVFGSREGMQRWLFAKVLYLDACRPIDLLKTESGREKVDEALGVIEWGMF
jgi:putative toxin-antitoxin system antitoxin component (TIGR02293 family)